MYREFLVIGEGLRFFKIWGEQMCYNRGSRTRSYGSGKDDHKTGLPQNMRPGRDWHKRQRTNVVPLGLGFIQLDLYSRRAPRSRCISVGQNSPLIVFKPPVFTPLEGE